MADTKSKEPQSYGSEHQWVKGETGQQVHDPKAAPPAQHADFYDERRESEHNTPAQGGSVSPVQYADNLQPGAQVVAPHHAGGDTAHKVTANESGAKRG